MPGVVRYTLRRNSSIRPRESNRQLWGRMLPDKPRCGTAFGTQGKRLRTATLPQSPMRSAYGWPLLMPTGRVSIVPPPLARFGLQNAFRFINKSIRPLQSVLISSRHV
jgi:hypothetical protein